MKLKPVWMDLLVAVLCMAVVFFVLFTSGFFQWWHDWSGAHHALVLNVVPSALLGVIAGLGWFAFRRWRAAQEGLAAQMRAEAESAELHRQFMDAVETVPLGVAFFDRDDRMAFCNSHYLGMDPFGRFVLMGGTFEENLRGWVEKGLFPDAVGCEEDWIQERLARHRQPSGPMERRMGERSLLFHEHRTPDGGCLLIIDDLTRRKRVEEALRESEARLWAILDNSPASVYLKDVEGHFLVVNREFERRNGITGQEVIGKTSCDFLPKETAAHICAEETQVIESRISTTFERTLEYRDGNVGSFLSVKFPVTDSAGELIGLGSISADVTDRKEVEERARELRTELAHVSRLSTMGELAAGFAHELNQPLAAINNYVTGVVRRMRAQGEGDTEFVPILESVSEQARRGGEIIRNIRRFIRKDDAKKTTVDVNPAIASAVDMLSSELSLSGIILVRELAASLPWVIGNAVEIQQVVLNLVRNSIEAVHEGPEPHRITVRTEPEGESGVRITVADSGPGIPIQVQQRLFEPFFTTKREGMGMGLLICRTIIEEHGGELDIHSVPDGGTVASFCIKEAGEIGTDRDEAGASGEKA